MDLALKKFSNFIITGNSYNYQKHIYLKFKKIFLILYLLYIFNIILRNSTFNTFLRYYIESVGDSWPFLICNNSSF